MMSQKSADGKKSFEEFAENFVSAAREVHSETEKSTAQAECSAPESLRVLAISSELPTELQLEHFFECSSCFQTYSESLKTATAVPSVSSVPWTERFRLGWIAAGFAATAVILITIFGLNSISNTGEQEEIARTEMKGDTIRNPVSEIRDGLTRGSERPVSSSNESIVNSGDSVNKERSKIEELPTRKGAEHVESVDLYLSEAKVLRSAGNTAANADLADKIELPAKIGRLNILLSKEIACENCLVTFKDAFGRNLYSKKISLVNKKLTLKSLDLGGNGKRATKLCIQNAQEIPDCFDISVAK